MKITRTPMLVAVAAMLTLSGAVAQDLPDAEALIAKYLEATGGADSAKSVKTMVMKGSFKMPEFNMEGKLTTYKDADGASVTLTDLGDMGTFRNGTKDGVAWDINPMTGNRILTGNEKATRLRSGEIDVLTDWKAHFKSAKTVTEATVDGTAGYKVEFEAKEGSPAHYVFAKDSGLLLQMEESSPTGKSVVKLQDYKKVKDVTMPHKIVIDFGQGTMVITVDSIDINGEVPAGTFDLPAEIKAVQ